MPAPSRKLRASIEVSRRADEPAVAEIFLRIKEGSWRELRHYLASLQDHKVRDVDVWAFASLEGPLEAFHSWVAAEPSSADARLVRGLHGISWAWEARTEAWASEVSDEQWKTFYKRLEGAKVDLQAAVRCNATDPTTYAALIVLARALGYPLDFVKRCLASARRFEPSHMSAHSMAMEHITRKWHGSHAEMFAFARRLHRDAPPGSPLHVLVPEAYMQYAYLDDAEVWESADVQKELIAAYAKSLGAPSFREDIYSPHVRNCFAWVFWKTGQKPLARELAQQIGLRPNAFPWEMQDKPAKAYARFLQWTEA